MDFIHLFNFDAPSTARRPRIFMERTHFNEDSDFQQRFRMNEEAIQILKNHIASSLAYPTARNHAFSTREQILTCLRFYATNSFYHVLRDSHGPSESTVYRCVRTVTHAIQGYLDLSGWIAFLPVKGEILKS